MNRDLNNFQLCKRKYLKNTFASRYNVIDIFYENHKKISF